MTTFTNARSRALAIFAIVMLFAAACSSGGSFSEVATEDDPQAVVEEPTVEAEEPTVEPEETPEVDPEPTEEATVEPPVVEDPPVVDDPPPVVDDPPPVVESNCTLDINGVPAFGEGELVAGFTPDPFAVPMTSGGLPTGLGGRRRPL